MKSLKNVAKLLIFIVISITSEIARADVSPDLFHQNPEQIAASMGHAYDPILASVMASVVSRQPKRIDSEWQSLDLGTETFPKGFHPFFKASIPIRFREGFDEDSPVFLIIPGSFATWKRGAFMDQTVAALDRISESRPHIFTFPGLFSPEFLEGRCDRVPSDFDWIARDLYLRIRPLIKLLGSKSVGIIGFSGGATMALRLSAIDRELFPADPIFNAGVIASSPILDLKHTFELLDSAHADVRTDSGKGLTTVDMQNVARKIKGFFKDVNGQIFKFFDEDESDFKDRFFNEFFAVDLTGVARSCEQQRFFTSGYNFNYSNFFGPYDRMTLENKRDLIKRGDLRPVLRSLQTPTLIHFPKDDPVLSRRVETVETPAIIDEILNVARENPKIQVVDPQTGGHTGLLLEPRFDSILREFFFPQPAPK